MRTFCWNPLYFVNREMDTIEEHSSGLVNLLQLCQQHNLNPLTHDKDPPHAKVASDIMSCLFMVRKRYIFLYTSYLY